VSACNIIDGNPYQSNNNGGNNNADTLKRVLLLEFTGHKCPNCPAGHEQINSLKNLYGDRFIPIAIHAGYYATTSASYPTDFRTTFGTELHNLFNPTSYPIGLVDALKRERLQTHGYWSESVSEKITTSSDIAIKILEQINEDSIHMSVELKLVKPNQSYESLRLYAMLLEDSIVSRQSNGSTVIENYVHNHVLRHGFTSHLGNSFVFDQNSQYNATFKVALNPQWRYSKLKLVAFVANQNDEVVQANSKHIRSTY